MGGKQLESFKLAGSPESVCQRRLFLLCFEFQSWPQAYGEQGAVSRRLTRGVNVEVQVSGLSPAAKEDLLANLAQEQQAEKHVPHTRSRPHKSEMLHRPHGQCMSGCRVALASVSSMRAEDVSPHGLQLFRI